MSFSLFKFTIIFINEINKKLKKSYTLVKFFFNSINIRYIYSIINENQLNSISSFKI